MTWNVLLLPSMGITFKRFRKMQHERLPYIIEFINNSDVDIIILQELLMSKGEKQLSKKLH